MNIEALKEPLDAGRVKTRSKGGADLSYIEGWWAISEANRIFGFDAWTRETVSMTQCGEPEATGDKWRVRFIAKVRITVDKTVVREGTGFGSGIAKDLGDAYEGAVKEAETDAMKRALMTFGNPFGLALYDKTQAGVASEADTYVKWAKEMIATFGTRKALSGWWAAERQARSDAGLTQAQVDDLRDAMVRKFPEEQEAA